MSWEIMKENILILRYILKYVRKVCNVVEMVSKIKLQRVCMTSQIWNKGQSVSNSKLQKHIYYDGGVYSRKKIQGEQITRLSLASTRHP
jgi:hypothetical protein